MKVRLSPVPGSVVPGECTVALGRVGGPSAACALWPLCPLRCAAGSRGFWSEYP